MLPASFRVRSRSSSTSAPERRPADQATRLRYKSKFHDSQYSRSSSARPLRSILLRICPTVARRRSWSSWERSSSRKGSASSSVRPPTSERAARRISCPSEGGGRRSRLRHHRGSAISGARQRHIGRQGSRPARRPRCSPPRTRGTQERIVVSHDRRTMTRHFRARLAAGQSSPGLFIVPQRMAIGEVIESLRWFGRHRKHGSGVMRSCTCLFVELAASRADPQPSVAGSTWRLPGAQTEATTFLGEKTNHPATAAATRASAAVRNVAG